MKVHNQLTIGSDSAAMAPFPICPFPGYTLGFYMRPVLAALDRIRRNMVTWR